MDTKEKKNSRFDAVYGIVMEAVEDGKEIPGDQIDEDFWTGLKQTFRISKNKDSQYEKDGADLKNSFTSACVSLGAHKRQGYNLVYDFEATSKTGDKAKCFAWISDPEKCLKNDVDIILTVNAENAEKKQKIKTSWTEPEFVEAINKMLYNLGSYVPVKNAKEKKKDEDKKNKENAANDAQNTMS